MSLVAALALAAPTAGVVVLPPESRGGQDAPWIAAAVADELPRMLGLLSVPTVEHDDLVEARDGLGIPEALATRATGIRLAESLGADRMVVGSYELTPEGLALSLRLLDVERGTLSVPVVASGPVETLPNLLQSLAWDIALSGPPPSRTREDLAALRPAVPFEAFQAYAQGLAAADPPARIRSLTRALALRPGYDEARLALGRAQLEARDLAAAQETLAAVPPSSSLARPARFLRGVALLRLRRYRDASHLYESLSAEERTAAVLNNLALALARLGGSRGRPATLLRQARDLEPGASDLPFNLGLVLMLEGEPEAAAFWLRGATWRDERDVHARLLLAWALRRSGREKEAGAEWQALLLSNPSYEPLAAPDLARRFERIRVGERAPAAEIESRSDAEVAAAHTARAEKLAAASDGDGALAELTRAAYLDPYAHRVHLLLARVHRSRGDREKAVGELRMSLWSRDDTAVRLELAALLKEQGRTAEARAEAQKVLKAEPGNADARRLAEGQ